MKKEEEEERYDTNRELVCHGLCVVRGVPSFSVVLSLSLSLSATIV
jgi:hypothetical protein